MCHCTPTKPGRTSQSQVGVLESHRRHLFPNTMDNVEETENEDLEVVDTEDTDNGETEGEETDGEASKEAKESKKGKKAWKILRMPRNYWKEVKSLEQILMDENSAVSRVPKEKDEVIELIMAQPCLIFARGIKIAGKKIEKKEGKELKRFLGVQKILEALAGGDEEVSLLVISMEGAQECVEVIVLGDWEGGQEDGTVLALKKRGEAAPEGEEEEGERKTKKFAKMPRGKAKKVAGSILTQLLVKM